MTLDQLKYFVAAATQQHVGRAASIVAISPSAISTAITALSEELGCELFRRKGRRLELTADGNRLLDRAKEIMKDVDRLKGDMRREPEALSGRFRLGGSHFLSSRILMKAWSDMQTRHPALVADIYSMNTAHLIAEIFSGRIDMGVAFSPLTHPDLEQTHLYEGDLRVIVRKSHPILKKPWKEQLRFLKSSTASFHRPTPGVESCDMHPIFEKMGVVPKIALYWDSDDIAIQSIVGSDYWTFVPDTVSYEFADRVQTIRLPSSVGEAKYFVSAVSLKSRALEPVLKLLSQTLKKSSEKRASSISDGKKGLVR